MTDGLIINGTSGNDNITGGVNNDTLKGLGGNDTINGGDGNDNIQGGDGDDTLNGDGGNDTIEGGAGVDVIRGGDGDDTLSDDGDSTIYGDAGNDTITGSNTYGLKVYGGDGNDVIQGKIFQSIDAGTGDDEVRIGWDSGNPPTSVIGGDGTDKLDLGSFDYVQADVNWSLISGFEEIKLLGERSHTFTDNVGQSGTTLKIRRWAGGSINLDFSSESDLSLIHI